VRVFAVDGETKRPRDDLLPDLKGMGARSRDGIAWHGIVA
jgi:hypothetical protein